MNFSQYCCFFPKFSTQQWVKEETGSQKKLDEDHHYHCIINGVYTLILFNVFVHVCILIQHTQQNIYTYIYIYIQWYIYTHNYIYIYIPHNKFRWFSILGNNHFVGTTHETTYIKRRDLYRRSAVSSVPPTVEAVEAAAPRKSWVFGTSEIWVGGGVPGICLSPGGGKENTWYTWIPVYIPENSWISISPKKGGQFKRKKGSFSEICYFSRDILDVFWGCFCWGVANGSQDASLKPP